MNENEETGLTESAPAIDVTADTCCPHCHADLSAARASPTVPARPARRPRSRCRAETYRVEILPPRRCETNRHNPYSALSPSERYERAMRRLAEVWSAICRRSVAETPDEGPKVVL